MEIHKLVQEEEKHCDENHKYGGMEKTFHGSTGRNTRRGSIEIKREKKEGRGNR